MTKNIKKYVEYLYHGPLHRRTTSREITHNDPLNIELKGKVVGFRFFEKELYTKDNKIISGKIKNKSNWYYLGKRLTLEEVLKETSKDELISNMKYNGYSSMCLTEYGDLLPMAEGDVTLNEYLEEQKQEENALGMFNNLKSHIGERIFFKAWLNGKETFASATLLKVNYFSSIVTDNYEIPFIGYGSAIVTIIAVDTGEVLYNNPYIEYGYNRTNITDVENAQKKFFGSKIVEKQKERRLKAEEKYYREQEIANDMARQKKYKLMLAGLNLVNDDLQEEWLQFVDENTNDAYSCSLVEASILSLKKLQNNESYAEVERACAAMSISKFALGEISSVLKHFGGYNFDEYLNTTYHIDEKLNEPILARKKDKNTR